MSEANKLAIRKLLKGIETGDPEAALGVNEAKYIQHNPQTSEGSEGLAALFARLAKSNPRVNIVRLFSDGDFVFGHTEYDFATRKIGFEVFRFEDGLAVEHWDNIQARVEETPSGRSMIDGPTDATDFPRTQANRELVRNYVQDVLICRRTDRLAEYLGPDGLDQHGPELKDGCSAVSEMLETGVKGGLAFRYDRLHGILAEGNFVLTIIEGERRRQHSSFYDLYRVSGGRITEQWQTVETIAPRADWKNHNGKF